MVAVVFFVLEQVGRLRVINADGTTAWMNLSSTFGIDWTRRSSPASMSAAPSVSRSIRTMPRTASSIVYYSAPLREGHDLQNEEWGTHTSHIAEIRVSEDDPNKADPDYERLVLQVDQPQFAHNAGTLAFRPEGNAASSRLAMAAVRRIMATIRVEGTSQDPGDLLGKILRIDVDQVNGTAYGIPDDNPVRRQGRLSRRDLRHGLSQSL